MEHELRRRRFFISLNILITLLWVLFVWTNDFRFRGNQSSIAAGSGHLPTLETPSILTRSPYPPATGFDPELEDQIIALLNQYRVEQGLTPLVQQPHWSEFARGFLNKAASNEITARLVQEQAFVSFPRREVRVLYDSAVLKTPGASRQAADVTSLWISRRTHNELDNYRFHGIGVGAKVQDGQILAVMILAEELFRYAADFPRRQSIDLNATLPDYQQKKTIVVERVSYQRGFFQPVIAESKRFVLHPSGNQVSFEIPVPGKFWSKLYFEVDGRRLHDGRPVSGIPLKP